MRSRFLKACFQALGLLCLASHAHALLLLDPNWPELARNCGVAIQALRPEIDERARELRVHPSVILAMIDQESQGDCQRVRHEKNGTDSVGLFQINSGTPGFARCTEDQLRQVEGSGSIDELRQGPQCIENPVFSLAKMAEVWKAKERTLKLPFFNVRIRGESTRFEGFPELDQHPEFRIRLLLAAFNGGEVWMAEAATIITQLNLEKRFKLNKYRWPDFESVLLQRVVSVADRQRIIGWKGRLEAFAQSNVNYVKEVLATAKVRFKR
ncbi:MAG TPA: hypothetical protein VM598_02445 [Bdellovibrionota bacterium]|nr:hypothetical protein [Bdellovibrionota bacterium]